VRFARWSRIGSSILTIASLALGIGVNGKVVSVVETVAILPALASDRS
jgi:hypothetical protein